MGDKAKYKETVQNFLAGIKMAWRVDPKLWRHLVMSHDFWEKVSHQLEQVAEWNTKDDQMIDEIVAQFRKETANLAIEQRIKKLDELLRGGWQSARRHASVRQKVNELLSHAKKLTERKTRSQ